MCVAASSFHYVVKLNYCDSQLVEKHVLLACTCLTDDFTARMDAGGYKESWRAVSARIIILLTYFAKSSIISQGQRGRWVYPLICKQGQHAVAELTLEFRTLAAGGGTTQLSSSLFVKGSEGM